jgi:hypothetical protein
MGNLPDLKKEAFRLTPEAPIAPQAYLWSGNAFIAILKEQLPANMADFDKQKDRLIDELRKRKQASTFEDFITALKKKSQVAPNMTALLKIPT